MGIIIKDGVQYGNKSGTVRFDQAQSLTDAQKEIARDNIGAGSGIVNDAADAGPISVLRAEGWAEQDGTPSPSSPQEIQVVRGHAIDGKAGRFVDIEVRVGGAVVKTIPIPLPSRGWVAALPDGTADVLTLDGAGGYVWEMGTAEVTFDGSSDERWQQAAVYANNARYVIAKDAAFNKSDGGQLLCSHLPEGNAGYDSANIDLHGTQHLIQMTVQYLTEADFKAWLSSHPVTVLYPLAAPVMESGYVEDWDNAIPPHAAIACPELRNLSVRCFADADVAAYGAAWYARGAAELGKLKTSTNNKFDSLPCLIVDCGTLSSLPTTINNTAITADMVVIREIFNNASIDSDLQYTCVDGAVTIAGTISEPITVTLYMMKSRIE